MPRPLPGAADEATLIGGAADVRPERALVLSASYLRRDMLGGVGARGELARVIDPVALRDLAGVQHRGLGG